MTTPSISSESLFRRLINLESGYAELKDEVHDLREQIAQLEKGRQSKRQGEAAELDDKILTLMASAPTMIWDRRAVFVNLGESRSTDAGAQRIVRRLGVLHDQGKLILVNDDPSRPLYKLA